MTNSLKHRALWLSIGLALILGGLAGPLTSGRALAGFVSCRTDPHVTLSNGVVFSLSATIYDRTGDVKAVTYSLHGPVGTTVTNITYSGYSFRGETFRYYADDPMSTYVSHIVATTGGAGIRVMGSTSIMNRSGVVQMTSSSSGTTGQDLGAHLVYVG